MKKPIYFVLAFMGIFILACNNPTKEVIENPYEGAWEITYSKYVYPDTTIETTQFVSPSLKILTEKHFAFGGQDGVNKIFGGGGEYIYDDTTYTERIKYHFYSELVGKSIEFKSKIEGEFWTISTVFEMDSLKIAGSETWKRIE